MKMKNFNRVLSSEISGKRIFTILGMTILLFIGSTLLVACGNAEEASNDSGVQEENVQLAEYQCPMDCEKGKKYDKAGICPVCEMDLAELIEE
jgi:hypothetical protein